MARLESLHVEIKMLSERKKELEHRVNAVLEENELLQNTVDHLRERSLLLEKQHQEKALQLHQSQLQLQELRASHRQLSGRFEELTEERSLQGPPSHPASLLCEIEQSMEQEEQEQEREQLRLQLWEAYCQVRSLVSHLRGNDITDSALSTDSSMDESSETSSAKDVPMGSLHASLLELRRLTQNLLDGNESTGSRRSEEALEDQVRKLGEELRGVRELYEAEQEKTRNNQEEVLQLHNKMAMLSVEVRSTQEERDRMKAMHDASDPSEQLQSAIRDRDEAISKKKAVEMELANCKIDIMSLNNQLLDAIQQKLNLSQQLEAWQVVCLLRALYCVALVVSHLVAFLSFRTTLPPLWYPPPALEDDMHSMIDQQLMEKHQDEWRATPFSLPGTSGGRGGPSGQSSVRAHRMSDGDKRLFSFFKKN
ncbi:hypothetical protein UPYG_G00186230 [Umbra pygmaea]|uniref:Bicaudal D-related protein 1 n=1 Tax=Umbra pygmaea TaxID=75934 RepID=A0ABD0WSG4_UMBPY